MTCNAKTKAGGKCKKTNGWGTEHPGDGRCRLHGGASDGRPLIHGRYSVKHRADLQAKYELFSADPEPGSLLSELAMQRAILQDFLDKIASPINKTTRDHAFMMIEGIGKLVERINRIMTATALTQNDLKYLQLMLTNLLTKYLKDPAQREAFLAELRAAVGQPRQLPPE